MKFGGEEQKREEDKKKGGVVGRIGRGIARMLRKGTERAEVEEGWWRGGVRGIDIIWRMRRMGRWVGSWLVRVGRLRMNEGGLVVRSGTGG